MSNSFPIAIHEGVHTGHSEFLIDEELLRATATDPNGSIRLSDADLTTTPLGFYGRESMLSAGETIDPGTLQGRRRNVRKGYPADSTAVEVETQSKAGLISQEDIESVLIHELVHVRQIKRREWSVRLGVPFIKISTLAGGIGAPVGANALMETAAHKGVSPLLLAVAGVAGAITAFRASYQIAPHEIQARKAQRNTPYLGIVKATPNPDYESPHERAKREEAETRKDLREAWALLKEIRAENREEQ
jgi:hypothetical protein